MQSAKRRSWLRTAVATAFVLAVLAIVWQQAAEGIRRRAVAENIRRRAVAENTTKALQLKVLIDRRFPLGSAESQVVRFLQQEHPEHVSWPATTSSEYRVPVGEEPSDVWYCGSWTRGVRLRFESGKLAQSVVDRWSVNCL
jgi:hypothetical protein